MIFGGCYGSIASKVVLFVMTYGNDPPSEYLVDIVVHVIPHCVGTWFHCFCKWNLVATCGINGNTTNRNWVLSM